MSVVYRKTAFGVIGVEEAGGAVTQVTFGDGAEVSVAGGATPLIREAFRQLEAYFRGDLKVFSLPLAPAGTPFQRRVWEVLLTIPYGETASYGDVAAAAGNVKAARAVGMANNRNPVAIMIPCHRVIGADGRLVGYGGGLELKRRLLELEGWHGGL